MVALDLSEAVWRKSSYSGTNGCVEVAVLGSVVAVRDSNDWSRVITFTREDWSGFLNGARDGEFDL